MLNFNLKCKKNISQDEIGKNNSRTEDAVIKIQYTDEVDHSNGTFQVPGLGVRFAAINGFFLEYLNAFNIPTSYRKVNENTLILQNHNRFPFSCKLQNITDKRSSKIFNSKEGSQLSIPVIQYHYGSQKDNIVTETHLIAFEACSNEELKIIKRLCSKINAVLKPYFERRNSILGEVNCFFGKEDDKIFLIDDFTPLSLKIISNGTHSVNPFKVKNGEGLLIYTESIMNLTNN